MRGQRTPIIIRDVCGEFDTEYDETEGIWCAGATDTVVYGSVHQKISEEANENVVGQVGERRRIVVRVPLDSPISYGDQIIINGINQIINGIYEIEGISFTRTHLRAVGRRMVKANGA